MFDQYKKKTRELALDQRSFDSIGERIEGRAMPESSGPRLFVVGDSFSVNPPADAEFRNWVQQARDRLTELEGREVTLINNSIMGACQDWAWYCLHDWIHRITPEDYVIVAVTHPARFWFLESMPDLTNASVIDLDSWVTKEQAKSIELFIKHIQRPTLDTMWLANRMGWLAYQVHRNQLRRPLMIPCFAQDLMDTESYKELNWSKGILMNDIQYWEFEDPSDDANTKYFYGVDPRYNHMCQRNHPILAERVAQALFNNTQLDITEGFHRGMITMQAVNDPEFQAKEYDLKLVEKLKKTRQEVRGPILPWKRRMGLEDKVTTCQQISTIPQRG
jgi:hypothetical protein